MYLTSVYEGTVFQPIPITIFLCKAMHRSHGFINRSRCGDDQQNGQGVTGGHGMHIQELFTSVKMHAYATAFII